MTRLALLALALPLAASAQTPKDAGKGTVPNRAGLPAAAMPLLDAASLPDTLRPGAVALPAAVAGETAFTVRLLQPSVLDMGTYTETVSVDEGAVTRVMRLVIPMGGQDETVTTTLDPATLAFRSVRADGRAATGAIDLAEGVAAGERAIVDASGVLPEPSPVRDEVPGPVFGTSWEYDLLPVLPLQAGDVYAVETYSLQDGLATATVTALGEVTLKRDGPPTPYLAAEVDSGDGPWTYYYDPATRELAFVRFSPQAGVEVEFVRN